ncbi:NifU-like protein involved in Fe-S cluster formation [Enterococcus asini]|nr:NifU-like protein involved in Fe-S cluster formation [Enterococcus asini]
MEMNNPTCGDVIHLELEVKDGIIENIAFDGSGCSISTASASMMTDVVLGKPVSEIEDLTLLFSDLVQGKDVPEAEHLGEAEVLAGVAKFPARIKCATLAWKALSKAVNDNEYVGESGNIQKHDEE